MNGDVQMEGEEVRMFVVRHAEHLTPTLGHLSRKGSLQASAVAATLKRKRSLAAVYTSPKSVETAQTIAVELNLPVTIDKRLLPFDSGRLHGLSREQVLAKMPDVYEKRFVQRLPDYKVPDGESLNDRLERVRCFLRDIVSHHEGEQVVIVTHGGIIDDLFRNAHSLPPTQLTGLEKPYGSLSVLAYDKGVFHEEVWGGVSHLPHVVAESPTGGQLYLFPHQVGGSFPMLRGDLGELCKPATRGELETYEVFAKECPEVARFVPTFLGKVVIDVMHIMSNGQTLSKPLALMNNSSTEGHEAHEPIDGDEESEGDVSMEGQQSTNAFKKLVKRESCSDLLDAMTPKRPRLQGNVERHDKRVRMDDADDHMMVSANPDLAGGFGASRSASSTGGLTTFAGNDNKLFRRSWSVNSLWDKFIERRRHKAVEVEKGKFVYLVMENLTHGLHHPHILDLKMGTQQHGSFESAAKKLSKQLRVETTTSKTVGARIGGMKVYDTSTQKYVLRDKYWGRSLDDAGLYAALKLFVTEQKSDRIHTDVVKDIISQLDGLERAVKSTFWRFYGCSVLIVFDGAAEIKQRVSQRARFESTGSYESDYSVTSFPETSAGLSPATVRNETIIQPRHLQNRAASKQQQQRGMNPRERIVSCDDTMVGLRGEPSTPAVVRLIDFAKCERHSTGTTYDEGLAFGISNLRRMFSDILLRSDLIAATNTSTFR